jgi:thymidylate synthase (FAD)
MLDLEARVANIAERLGLDNPQMPFALKKKLQSAIRRLLPNGMGNHIIVTANHRAWRHILEARGSLGAEEEIRNIVFEVARQLEEKFPAIYQDMTFQQDTHGTHYIHFFNSKV